MRKRKLISLDKNIFKMLKFWTGNKSANEAALDRLDLLTVLHQILKKVFAIQYLSPALYDRLTIFYDDNICFTDFSLLLKRYVEKRTTISIAS